MMSKMDRSVLWAPEVLGKDRIDERRWAYAVPAPFDMPPDISGMLGMKVSLDGAEFEIRGFVPPMPLVAIKQGEAIELLVRSASPLDQRSASPAPSCSPARRP
jgi:hypothetical protein